MNEIEQQLLQYERQVREIPDYQAKSDLKTMIDACYRLYSEISREAIQCRRTQRPTLRYRELIAQYETQTETLECFILQATLTYL